MKRLTFLFLLFVLFSCTESDQDMPMEESEPEEPTGAIDANGVFYPGLDPLVIYCGPGWGDKFCRFLGKYGETIWADSENYYSEFSDIKFSNFSGHPFFISFFDLDNVASYCDGWKLGETSLNGKKWNIEIVRDEVDILWFKYDYYGSSVEIESTILYKYEVINGLLHFSTTDGQSFVFHPSEKNYSMDILDTEEINVLEGCFFY